MNTLDAANDSIRGSATVNEKNDTGGDERLNQILKVRSLSKSYSKKKVLREVSLSISAGEIFGVIGPDGAGKTTLLSTIAGITIPESGTVEIVGSDSKNASTTALGYVPQSLALYADLTIGEHLDYQAGLCRVKNADFPSRKKQLLEDLGLARFADRLSSQLSGGMKQKLALACALVSEPRVVILDEPTTGLDPLARAQMWESLRLLSERGAAVLIATPFLEESNHCDRVSLLYDGVIEKTGTPDELKDSLESSRLLIESDVAEDLNEVEDVLKDLEASQNIRGRHRLGNAIEVISKEPESLRSGLLEKITDRTSDSLVYTTEKPTMENVFIAALEDLGDSQQATSSFPSLKNTKETTTRSGDDAIKTENLRKEFGDFTAVENLTLTVKRGTIVGLLGANGAGKTTSVKMMCGLLEPSSGMIQLNGEAKKLRKDSIRRSIGYMSQKFTLYDRLTVQENLQFYAAIYEIPRKLRVRQIQWAIDACGLEKIKRELVQDLPLGWKQRVSFGAAVMHDPEIIFLDEPTAGVDPLARRQLWRLIRELRDRGAAILVTTHHMDEAEYCDSLAFMAEGEMRGSGTTQEIRRKVENRVLMLHSENLEAARTILDDSPLVIATTRMKNDLKIYTKEVESPDTAIKELNGALEVLEDGARVQRKRPELDDAFVILTTRRQEKK